jgi:membrane protease YdiL (CAAX protease family)
MEQNIVEKHSAFQSIVLHLFPGILMGIFYFLVRQPVMTIGYPPVFALVLAAIFILIPFELGYLLYQGKQKTGQFTLKGVISYRQSIPWWQYLVWVLGVFLVTGMIFTLIKPVGTWLQQYVFFWVPGLDMGLDGTYSKNALIFTYSLFFVFVTVLGPLVEELYFRGYLLPRTPGKFASVLHSFLFASYHVFSPWMIVIRTLGLLPMVYAVKRKNIYIGMIVHVLLNSLDMITAIAFITKMA